MAKSQIETTKIADAIEQLGMRIFGSFGLTADLIPPGNEALANRIALLIGNVGSDMWERFSVSDEFADGAPHSLDRWTEKQVDKLAATINAMAVYPFTRPFWPFQKFSAKACGMAQSPLGLFIHPEFGLWQAYRALLILDQDWENRNQFKGIDSRPEKLIHPCDTCQLKPCLSACPVGAFDGQSLATDKCFKHLYAGEEPQCMTLGCRARDACPIGHQYRYSDEQIRFHMKAYRK